MSSGFDGELSVGVGILGRTRQRHLDLLAARTRGGLDIQDGLDRHRVGKIDRAGRDRVDVPADEQLAALAKFGAAGHRRRRGGAHELKVARQAGIVRSCC